MNVGFIGLGIMGKPMARNLLRAGYKVYAYDIVGSSVDCVVQDGAVPCSTVEEGVAQALALAGTDGVACALGSLYMTGKIRACFGPV